MVSFASIDAARKVVECAGKLAAKGVDASLIVLLDTRFLFSVLLSPPSSRRDAVWLDLSWLCNFAEPGADLMRVRAALGLLDADDERIRTARGKFGFVDTSVVNLRLRWGLAELGNFTSARVRNLAQYFAAVQVSESTDRKKYVGSMAKIEDDDHDDNDRRVWGFEASWFLSNEQKKAFVTEAVRTYERDEGLPAGSLSIESKNCGARGERFEPTEEQQQASSKWKHTRGVLKFGLAYSRDQVERIAKEKDLLAAVKCVHDLAVDISRGFELPQ